MKKLQIALVQGEGTGNELIHIFKLFTSKIYQKIGIEVEYIQDQKIYNTYNSIRKKSPSKIKRINSIETNSLVDFYTDYRKQGGHYIFRTAINAEVLYLVRKKLKAVQISLFDSHLNNYKLYFIRDETQGFYSNDSTTTSKKKITLKSSYHWNNFCLIKKFLENEIEVNTEDYSLWFVYKHHLFLNIIETWINDLFPNSKLFQPNHASATFYDNLIINNNLHQDLVIVCGNEIGDIFKEIMEFLFNKQNRFCAYSHNYYLDKKVFGLIEYQTLHGSADDLAGKNIVNPIATLKCAASIIDKELKKPMIYNLLDQSIKASIKKDIITPDMGGDNTTIQLVEFILNYLLDRI